MSYLNKKILIITGAALLAAAAAITTVIMIVKFTEKSVDTKPISDESDIISSDIISGPNGPELIISSPEKDNVSVTDPSFTFSGSADPQEKLTVNGEEIEHNDGTFTYSTKLEIGKNTFEFIHKNKTLTYTVTYRYVIIESYNPSKSGSYESGSIIGVNVTARRGSTVTATFNKKTVTLTPDNHESDSTFISYAGGFTLPDGNAKALNLGKITYKASFDGKTETFSSGNITCLKDKNLASSNQNVTPTGGKYINVGSGYIAEIVQYQAETFDGKITKVDSSIDWSRPTNNYLPQGTLDYCSQSYVTYNDTKYVTLRSGQRVYLERRDKPYNTVKPVVKQYKGTLPDHNEIRIAGLVNNSNSHTVLTFDTLWKAPFYFDIGPQAYTNPSKQQYTVSAVTFDHIDITFCYATVFSGKLDLSGNTIFSSAQVIKNKSDYTLRLNLRKKGAFYGWDSYYNSKGQLCFEFLNPKTAANASNAYGASLKGIKVLIDVGHGGIDCGAVGFDSKNHSEAIQNLVLAQKIKTQLESIGAKVVMTRTGNTTSSTDDKLTMLRREKPDYCIAIHHNSHARPEPCGFSAYYYNPFSKEAAKLIYSNTISSGIYNNGTNNKLDWHVYFVARNTVCPVVLTENGFISNQSDYNNIKDGSVNEIKAAAIVRGIVAYFKSVTVPNVSGGDMPPVSSDTPSSSEPPVSSLPPSSSVPDDVSSEQESSSSSEPGSSSEGELTSEPEETDDTKDRLNTSHQ